MIAFTDRRPEVEVLRGEYRRLLGYPPHASLHERARELECEARAWYAVHGRPWLHAVEIDRMARVGGGLELDGVTFTANRLSRMVDDAGANRVVVVGASAGPEAEAYAAELWAQGKPDEYYFVEMYASAVVEHLVMTAGARLCAVADGEGVAVLPHDSPGYPGWDVAEQGALLGVLAAASGPAHALPLEALDSGMLRPKKSLLAVFALTPHVDRVRRLTDLVPCDECALERCQFRRRPYRRLVSITGPERADVTAALETTSDASAPISTNATYSVNLKALRRWAAERLTLARAADGTIQADFRYDGTTCTNMGRPIAWDFHVTLGPREAGYPIQHQQSRPAVADEGHTSMCRYISQGEELMRAIATEAPLAGRRLDEVLGWTRSHAAAGCFCDADSRTYKWGLVFETIHYALAHQEMERRPQPPEETRP